MATVTPTTTRAVGAEDGSVVRSIWVLTTADADGAPINFTEWADKCIQAVGTWGGATLTLQGSNDGTNWFSMTNAAGGSAATFTADGGKQVIEAPLWFRPNLTTPGVGATVTVTLIARRQTPLRT